jgi:heterodisulfide reductase subunit C
MSCFKCRERCPQKVAPVEVLFALKNMAVAGGKQIPGNYTALLQSVLSIGLIQDVKSVTTRDNKTKNRADLGLPEVSKPTDPTKFQMILSKLAVEKV